MKAAAILALAGLSGTAPCLADESAARKEFKAIAGEAFFYGIPMLVGYDVISRCFIPLLSG